MVATQKIVRRNSRALGICDRAFFFFLFTNSTNWREYGQKYGFGRSSYSGLYAIIIVRGILEKTCSSCAFLPTFFFSFLSYFFPASRYVYLLRVPSSVQSSATLSKYVFDSTCSFCLCHLYPTPSRNYFVSLFVWVFFSQLLFLGWRFFCCCCAVVPGTLALGLPPLIL